MPSISWRKNGQTVYSGSKFSFDQYKKRLTIQNPSKADEGDYECHVTSSLSPQPRTSKANLTVIGKQIFFVTFLALLSTLCCHCAYMLSNSSRNNLKTKYLQR